MSFSPQVTRTRGDAAAPRRRWVVGAVIAGCLLVVLLLGLGVRFAFGPQIRLDHALSRDFYAGDHRSKLIDVLLNVVTAPGSSVARLVIAIPVVAWLLRHGARRSVLWVAVAYGLIGPITTLGKYIVDRVRPPFAQGGALNHSPSFPSGHSSGIATTVVVGLVLAWPVLSGGGRRVWSTVGAVVVVLVGLSRMWLGEHYLSDVVAGWSLGIAWTLLTALLLGAPRRPGGAARAVVTELQQRVVLAPDDGSLGPLLRVSDDRLPPGVGYGLHDHRAVDVVAVVLAGSLQHRWGDGATLGAGDVAVLRAGAGLAHDEVAGDDGARVLQCYLRAADPGAPPAHEVHRRPTGWLDLGRDDARVWVGAGAGDVPAGVAIPLDDSDLRVVWEVAAGRPEWARG